MGQNPHAATDPDVSSGIVNVWGQEDVTVEFGSPVIVQSFGNTDIDLTLHGGANAMLNVFGQDTLSLTEDWPAKLVTAGGTMQFIAESDINGGTAVFNNTLTGNGNIWLKGGGGAGAAVEVNGWSAPSLNFNEIGVSSLTIDHPSEFYSHVDLGYMFGGKGVDLVGLATADHWSFANDMLSVMTSQGYLLDRLHVTSDDPTIPAHGLSVVSDGTGGLLVHAGNQFSGVFS